MKAPPTLKALSDARITFGDPGYQRHNARRLEHLASLGLDLVRKSVLELGAGVGDHTTFFLDRGCAVVSVEPRTENCALFKQAMAAYPRPKAKLIQSDVEMLYLSGQFDIVYAYGLLYHLAEPESALRAMAYWTRGMLLLETRIAAETERGAEDTVDPSNSFHGFFHRPTAAWLTGQLKSLFPFVYVPIEQPFHEDFPLKRAIFVASRLPLSNPRLSHA